MCGIVGKIVLSGGAVREVDLVRMTDAIYHRGPDDSGAYVSPDGKVGLGHRRLSIIDLSPLGKQPMRYLDRYQIVFNGEIYNFQEQRAELERAGYQFRSHTDTEVIAALYDKHGVACLQHLRGMFAFAIYDEKTKQLFCARDRIGKKPFKYYFDGKVFLFASELKAILTQPEYHRDVDYVAIHHYLTLQYVPAPLTGFKGIKKLLPAHYLLLDVASGQMRQERYWHLDFSHKLDMSEAEWQRVLTDKLRESVRLRMVADVPVGAFLSGGIDSSAVVGLMSELSARPVRTFSIGFPEDTFNELPYARHVADLFKTEHTEFTLQPEGIDILPRLVRQYEEPYADSSALPTYYLSELTRQHVTVALNGDGGDENFGGYGRYSVQKFALRYEQLRPLNQHVALPVAAWLATRWPSTFLDRSARFARTWALDYRHRYVNYVCYFTNEAKKVLYTKAMRKQLYDIDSTDVVAQKFLEAATPDKLDQTLYGDITTFLVDDLMTKADIATMAVSLEARSPFLDHEFMELAAKIPSHLKIKGTNQRKYILKEALRGMLPNELLDRPKKGFQAPIDVWFRGQWQAYAHDVLLSPQAMRRGMFNRDAVEQIVHTHTTTPLNQATHIWALLTLELWFREYFDAPISQTSPAPGGAAGGSRTEEHQARPRAIAAAGPEGSPR